MIFYKYVILLLRSCILKWFIYFNKLIISPKTGNGFLPFRIFGLLSSSLLYL